MENPKVEGTESDDDYIRRETPRIYSLLVKETLLFVPTDWKITAEAVSKDGVERSSVVLTCKWEKGFLAKPILVGASQESLDHLPVEISIERARDDIIDALMKVNQRRSNKGTPHNLKGDTDFIGLLSYYEPIKTADGVVNQQHGSLNAWIYLGDQNYDLLVSHLNQPSISIGVVLTLRFPSMERVWIGHPAMDIVDGRIVLTPRTDEVAHVRPDADEITKLPAHLVATFSDISKSLDQLRTGVFCCGVALFILAMALFNA